MEPRNELEEREVMEMNRQGDATLDVWGKLWDLATGMPGKPARIEPDPEDGGIVTLVYADGSRGTWYWHDGDWRPEESADSTPCDISARDSS